MVLASLDNNDDENNIRKHLDSHANMVVCENNCLLVANTGFKADVTTLVTSLDKCWRFLLLMH